MFKEFGFATKSGFVRNILKDETYINEFLKEHNEDVYATFMSYDVPNQENSKLIAPLAIDIDSENLEESKEEAKKVVDLFLKIGVASKIYFSGAKGFHIVIPWECFGITPRFLLIDVYKSLMRGLIETNKLKHIDLKIYERKRLFRINNTLNSKSGLYKIQLTKQELDLSIDEIKKLATKTRDLPSTLKPTVSEQLKAAYLRTEDFLVKKLEKKHENRITSLGDLKLRPCIQKILEKGVDSGERNDTCYTLALFFKSQNVIEEEAVEALRGFSGLPEREIQRTVMSAYKSQHSWGCNDNDLVQRYCDKDRCPIGFQKKSIADLVWNKDALIKELDDEEKGLYNTKLTFGLPEFEEKWGNIRKDELIIVAADAGIGKTTYAYWMTKKNTEKGNRVLFCSLEMATRSMLARACKETKTSYADMKKWVMEAPVFFYKDGQRLSTKNLRRNLEESVKDNFGFDLIVIDHLGYVEKQSDKLYESISQIAEDLANFAKDLSIPVVLLTHFNKGQAGASNKPRSINDILGSGRLRDFASKVLQIWYPQENNDVMGTAFILHKNRYGTAKTITARYFNGGYIYDDQFNF